MYIVFQKKKKIVIHFVLISCPSWEFLRKLEQTLKVLTLEQILHWFLMKKSPKQWAIKIRDMQVNALQNTVCWQIISRNPLYEWIISNVMYVHQHIFPHISSFGYLGWLICKTEGLDKRYFIVQYLAGGVWKLCPCNAVAKSDGVGRLVWEFQRNITGMVSCWKLS